MTTKEVLKEKMDINQLSPEAMQILDILDEIENHTANLRKKLMSELKKNNSQLNIDIENN